MSHFTVLVIGDEPEKQLEPYNENLTVPRYVRHTKQQLIDNRKKSIADFRDGLYAKYLADPETYILNCKNSKHIEYLKNEFPLELNWDDEQIYQDAIKFYEPEDIGENGEVYSTYNPTSKWDWYQIGGRWDGLLQSNTGKNVNSGFIQDLVKPLPTTFAILKNGEWYERGEMGWFGQASNEISEDEWEAKTNELLSSLPDNTLITLIDCHI